MSAKRKKTVKSNTKKQLNVSGKSLEQISKDN